MVRWLRIWTKIYHYHWPVIGFCGMIATVVLSSPGEYSISVGPLQLDMFYITLVSFGLLFALSATDEYNPEDYGLSSSNSEK